MSAGIQIQIQWIWQKSLNPDLNPNPDLDLPTIDPFVEKKRDLHPVVKKTRLLGGSKGKNFAPQVDQDVGDRPVFPPNISPISYMYT